MDLRCIRTKKNGLMIFIQKTDTSLVSIALSQGRTNFSKCENLKSVLLLGAQGTAPVPHWGAGQPPDPSPGGGP